jgi:hypothetical protein
MKVAVSDELIEAIAELRGLFPDWRMGQLVANVVMAAGGTDPGAIWEREDDQLLAAARRLIERNRARRTARNQKLHLAASASTRFQSQPLHRHRAR